LGEKNDGKIIHSPRLLKARMKAFRNKVPDKFHGFGCVIKRVMKKNSDLMLETKQKNLHNKAYQKMVINIANTRKLDK
jgi:hypothetical protein